MALSFLLLLLPIFSEMCGGMEFTGGGTEMGESSVSVLDPRLDKLERLLHEEDAKLVRQETLLRQQDAKLSHEESMLHQQDAKMSHQ